MPKKSNEQSLLLTLFSSAGQILIAIGTPPLFALKIIVWLLIRLGNFVLEILLATTTLRPSFKHFSIKLTTFSNGLILQLTSLTTALLSVPLPLKTVYHWPPTFLKTLPFWKKTLLRNLYRYTRHLKKSILTSFSPQHPRRRISLKLTAPAPSRLTLGDTLLNKYRSFPKFHFPKINLSRRISGLSRPVSIPKPPRPGWKLALSLFFFITVPLLAFASFELYLLFSDLPNPEVLAYQQIPVTTKIYDRHGVPLYQIYTDQNRNPINLSDLPPYVAQATIAIEDKNFYHHEGFDVQSIIRAALADSTGSVVQGGSTITQQLIKYSLLSPQKTLNRKIREIVLSYQAEHIYSKDQILSMYLNEIPYGGSAYGIEAAAQTYFGTHSRDLTLAQAALIAGLPSSPTTYSPFGPHPELAKVRQGQVLDAMAQQGYITPFAANNAKQEPLKFASLATEIKAPHFVMYVKDYLAQKYGLPVVEQGGLQVITTLDYSLYENSLKILQDGVAAQKNLNVGNGAVLITNPQTGEILSMIGSTDYFNTDQDGNVNVTTAQRSPGSSIKPLNYALAFEKGLLTPSTLIDDQSTTFHISGSPPYTPVNYDHSFHGRVTARVALGSSYNIPAVKVLEKNGLSNFIDFARGMGITTFTDPSRYGLSLTLGGGEVKMADMATAYSTFADQGKKVSLTPILQIKDYKGNLLEDNTRHPSGDQVISPKTAFLISDILADNSARTPTFGPNSPLYLPGHTISVKTGTTQDTRDNWTIGYTFGPNPYLVAVWVGNNDNSPMSSYLESGNTGAAAIWNPLMKLLLTGQKDSPIPKPDDLIAVPICALTGTLPCDGCPNVQTEYFTKGSEPKNACQVKKEDWPKILDQAKQKQVP